MGRSYGCGVARHVPLPGCSPRRGRGCHASAIGPAAEPSWYAPPETRLLRSSRERERQAAGDGFGSDDGTLKNPSDFVASGYRCWKAAKFTRSIALVVWPSEVWA